MIQSNSTSRTDDGTDWGNKRAHLPWGSTLLTCPVCDSSNIDMVKVDTYEWTHDDGRPATNVGMLLRCLNPDCGVTFRLAFHCNGLPRHLGGHGESILMEHFDSSGIWS